MRTADAPLVATLALILAPAALAAEDGPPTTEDRPSHQTSAEDHPDAAADDADLDLEVPPLPEGMTLDEVLDYSATPPPEDFPPPIPDRRVYAFFLVDQLAYRVAADGATNHLGWEDQGWVGGDLDKLWWKNEGEAAFEGAAEGEMETDLLYSRLVTPFWNVQIGARYANEWATSDYEDRWSGVLALQGLAPFQFEIDASLVFSEHGDLTAELEGEYDVRITQRLVLQPRAELGFSAQEIPERDLGPGLTGADLDLRLRYEILRELAPYAGVRYAVPVGATRAIAKGSDDAPDDLYLLAGVRLAF